MLVRKILLSAVLLSTVASVTFSAPSLAAKKWTVTQRQEALYAEINKALKANNLTLKEANDLKDEHAGIIDKEKKMKDKNGGKLSPEDENKIEKSLNTLSEHLQKKQLQKRVK
jgi:hypothetical protein